MNNKTKSWIYNIFGYVFIWIAIFLGIPDGLTWPFLGQLVLVSAGGLFITIAALITKDDE